MGYWRNHPSAKSIDTDPPHTLLAPLSTHQHITPRHPQRAYRRTLGDDPCQQCCSVCDPSETPTDRGMYCIAILFATLCLGLSIAAIVAPILQYHERSITTGSVSSHATRQYTLWKNCSEASSGSANLVVQSCNALNFAPGCGGVDRAPNKVKTARAFAILTTIFQFVWIAMVFLSFCLFQAPPTVCATLVPFLLIVVSSAAATGIGADFVNSAPCGYSPPKNTATSVFVAQLGPGAECQIAHLAISAAMLLCYVFGKLFCGGNAAARFAFLSGVDDGGGLIEQRGRALSLSPPAEPPFLFTGGADNSSYRPHYYSHQNLNNNRDNYSHRQRSPPSRSVSVPISVEYDDVGPLTTLHQHHVPAAAMMRRGGGGGGGSPVLHRRSSFGGSGGSGGPVLIPAKINNQPVIERRPPGGVNPLTPRGSSLPHEYGGAPPPMRLTRSDSGYL